MVVMTTHFPILRYRFDTLSWKNECHMMFQNFKLKGRAQRIMSQARLRNFGPCRPV